MSAVLPKRGLNKQGQAEGRQAKSIPITNVAYRPATVVEVKADLRTRKDELQDIAVKYKDAKQKLRDAIVKYRSTQDKDDKQEVLKLTKDISENYYSQANLFNSIHNLHYNPSSNLNSLYSVPATGYLVKDLLFDHYRTTKIPEAVGILTYPQAYPAEWFFKQKVEALPQSTAAELGAQVGSEGNTQQGGGDEPKKQLSSRQIGAIIAARKARHF